MAKGRTVFSRRKLIQSAGHLLGARAASGEVLRALAIDSAESHTASDQERTAEFVARAERLKPVLHEVTEAAKSLVKAVPDPSEFLRWRMEPDGSPESLANRTFRADDSFIIDFGGHRTGYLSFSLEGVGRSVDAPTRLRLVFGEVPGDVAEPLHPYKGNLSEGWLPEEIVTVDFLPRKYACPGVMPSATSRSK